MGTIARRPKQSLKRRKIHLMSRKLMNYERLSDEAPVKADGIREAPLPWILPLKLLS